jgi:hypothetical protein
VGRDVGVDLERLADPDASFSLPIDPERYAELHRLVRAVAEEMQRTCDFLERHLAERAVAGDQEAAAVLRRQECRVPR